MSRRTSHRRSATTGKSRRGREHDSEAGLERKRMKSRRGEVLHDAVEAIGAEVSPDDVLVKEKHIPATADGPRVVAGLVSITEDEDFGITGVQLFGDDGELYHILFDGIGVALGDEMDQMRAEVSGSVVSKASGKWIHVESYRELER